jgi:hypothetical protein
MLLAMTPRQSRAADPQASSPSPDAKVDAKVKKTGSPSKRRAPSKRGPAHAGESRATGTATPQITPFPRDQAAVAKAFAQQRRQQLADAEKAARAAQQSDRWQAVLFEIRDLDSRSDPEACFWRVVAYYRMGQLERARTMRGTCELPTGDASALEAEDAAAFAAQQSEPGTGSPVNLAAYAGPAPTVKK